MATKEELLEKLKNGVVRSSKTFLGSYLLLLGRKTNLDFLPITGSTGKPETVITDLFKIVKIISMNAY